MLPTYANKNRESVYVTCPCICVPCLTHCATLKFDTESMATNVCACSCSGSCTHMHIHKCMPTYVCTYVCTFVYMCLLCAMPCRRSLIAELCCRPIDAHGAAQCSSCHSPVGVFSPCIFLLGSVAAS